MNKILLTLATIGTMTLNTANALVAPHDGTLRLKECAQSKELKKQVCIGAIYRGKVGGTFVKQDVVVIGKNVSVAKVQDMTEGRIGATSKLYTFRINDRHVGKLVTTNVVYPGAKTKGVLSIDRKIVSKDLVFSLVR